jgi:endonuclease-3
VDDSDDATVATESTSGTYALVVGLPDDVELTVGALGTATFPAGGYVYVGSALGTGGFSRVDRHRRVATGRHDARHWHVDYLAGHQASRLRGVVTVAGRDVECALAERIPAGPLAGFGASDCDCEAHLGRCDSVAAALDAALDARDDVQ